MNLIRCAVLTCLALAGATLPAKAAFQLIYVVLGVRSNASDNNFVTTAVHCTNVSTNPVAVRVFARNETGNVVGNVVTVAIGPQRTHTFSAMQTVIFADDSSLNTGVISQGHMRILTEVPGAVFCAADMLDAANVVPTFVAARRMIRFPRSASGGED